MRFDQARQFKILEDSNGFITAEGVIASSGEKLVYKDGTETVTDSALFNNMDEWEGLPLTLTHPRDLLKPETAQKHQVGSVVKAWRKDNQLWAKFKVTTKQALDAVRGGMRGLSAGYNVHVDDAKNQIQRFNNHLALVSVGRSPSSGIRSDERRDSFDLEEGLKMQVLKFPNGKEIKLDCSEAEAQLLQGQIDAETSRADVAEKSLANVATFLSENFDMEEGEDMPKKLDMMKKEIADMKEGGKNTEKLQATYDALFEKMEKSKGKMDSDDLAIIFDTHELAQKLDAKITIRNDDGSIKTARDLAEQSMPDVKFDGKDDSYVMARLDATIEFSSAENVKKQRGDGKEKDTKSTLTVQQRSDAKFFTPKGE